MELQLRKNAEQFKGWYSRQISDAVRVSTFDEKTLSIKNVIATEQPVIVFDWYRWEPIREILLLDGMHLPESRQVPLLDNHSRFTISNIMGSTRDIALVGNRLEGTTYFDSGEDKLIRLVREGHLTDTSIGYKTFDNETVILKKGEKTVVRGRTFENNFEDDLPLYLRIKSELKENSATPIGADVAAKFRSETGFISIPSNGDDDLIRTIENELKNPKSRLSVIINNERSQKMTDEERKALEEKQRAEHQAALDKAVKDAAEKESERVAALHAMGNDFSRNCPHLKMDDVVTQFIQERKSPMELYRHLSAEMKKPEAIRTPDTNLGMSEKQVQSYSVRKILLYQLGKIDEKEVGLELEAHRTLVKNTGAHPHSKGGIFIPDDIMRKRTALNYNRLSAREQQLLQRANFLQVGDNDKGGYTVKEEWIPQSFIEILETAMLNLGVEFITGIKGNLPMIRELDSLVYYHVGEGSGPTKSGLTFGREVMTPKKAGAITKYSYEFLMQSSLAVEAYIERRLGSACARGAFRDIHYGTGSDYQPKGIKNWTGIGGVDGTNFNRKSALTMEAQIETANASILGTPKFVSRGSVRSHLKDVKVIEGKFLVSDQNDMIGYDYSMISNAFDAGDLFFGIYSDVFVPYWNMVEIMANPYGDDEFAAGDVVVRALQALDVFVRNPAAFSLAEDVPVLE